MKEIIIAYDENTEASPVMGDWVGELVRCKDCVYEESFLESYRCYFDEENESGCKRSHDADFFCAYGKRKGT